MDTSENPAGSGSAPRPDDHTPLTAQVPRVWGRVPLRNTNFIGRTKVLDAVHDGVTSGTNAVLLYAFHGLAGVGKTQIAAEYAHRHKSEYDVVWWIPADQPVLILSSIAGLAPHLGLGANLSVEVAAPSVLDALRRADPYGRWLLIFDNADQPESIMKLLLDGPGHTIITSRNPDWESVVEGIRVDVFTRDESHDFFDRRVPGIGINDSDALADALGDLPLALEQAVTLQSRTAMSPRQYLNALAKSATRLLSDHQPTEYPVPVTAAWALSIARLKEELPNAVVLLRTCAVFGPEPIPRDVISEGRGAVPAELNDIIRDPFLLNQAIGGLSRYSLAQVNREARTIQVHRVVQAIVREELSPAEADKFRQYAHYLLASATPGDPDDSSTWARFRDLQGHFNPSRIVKSRDIKVRHMVRSVIRYHYMVGNYAAALELGQQALEDWSNDPDTKVSDILAIKRHLGNTLRALGQYSEAFQVNEEAMRDANDRLGPDDDETLRITNSHGADLRAKGQFSVAYALDEESVRRHERVLGDEDRRTLRARNNFALDLELAGDYSRARELHERVYEAGPAVYGSDEHPSVLITLNNLARVIRLSGQYAEALSVSEDVYASCAKTLGKNHPITLPAMKDLAIARRLMLGGSEEAVSLAVELVDRYERLRNENHPRTLAAKIALVNVMREAGDVGHATPIAEAAIRQFPDVYGAEHPYTYACMGNLALLRRLSGDPQNAMSMHQQAVAGLEATVGPNHCYTLTCAVGLASDLCVLGDLKGARELGSRTLTALRGVLGEDHPITLACAINVASDLSALQLAEEAERLRGDTLGRYMQVLGDDHPAVRGALAGQRLDCDFDPS